MKIRKFFLLIYIILVMITTSCANTGNHSNTSPTQTVQQNIQVTPVSQENQEEPQEQSDNSMAMIFIPGSTFQMGSTQSEIEAAIALCREHYDTCNRWYYERESPRHSVSLDDYWIGQTEISNAQYQLCVDADICKQPLACQKGEPTFGDPAKADLPVVCVDWENAQTYCQWADTRLPTEAEWEYAFRGDAGLIFPWGDEFDGSRLNYCDANCSQAHADDRFEDGYALSAPVGSYPSGASWAGVLNLSGNVSEWVADWFGEYTPEAISNPLGPASGSKKIIRGGSWFYHPTYCRAAIRASVSPDTRFDYLGFRCASSDPKISSTDQESEQSQEITEITEITETHMVPVETVELNLPNGILGEVWNRPTADGSMVFVPGSTFMMGSLSPDPFPVEFPAHEVQLDSYWIDQTEVFNAQYHQCVDAGACRKSRYANSTAYNGDNYPAVGVAWGDAVDYCAWIGGRLPTEAEWEYAAKGTDGMIFPWGDEFVGDQVNFCDANCDEDWADANFDDGFRESAPVGSYPGGSSWVGALDMAGNVWEWAADWCASYSSNSQINPRGSEQGNCKIIRGGAWDSPSDGIRTTYRVMSDEITPDIRHPNIGFRCVVPVDQKIEGGAGRMIDPILPPSGNPPAIDGTHSPGEWNQAAVETFADGSQLFLMQSDGYLYLGIRVNQPGMVAGNVFIQREDQISVLHTSAALGTAIFQRSEDSWLQVQDFTWCCRNTSNSESAQAEREEFLQEEGWLAANGLMGTPNELEYQIKIAQQDFHLAVVYIESTPPYEKIPWPAQLDDDCIAPASGGLPQVMQFSPDQWVRFDLSAVNGDE